MRAVPSRPTGLVAWALVQPASAPAYPSIKEPGPAGFQEEAYLLAKRAVDVVVSVLLLAISWPVMLLTTLAVKLTRPGPTLFAQRRAGLHGRPFVMYRFRSMREGAEEARSDLRCWNDLPGGPCFKTRQDPGLTPIGRFLRQTTIDELPQIFNVLKGEMSLVGPRPLPLTEVRADTPAERARLAVLPGLTCLGQISGRSEIPYDEWLLLDSYYVQHRSLFLDLEILLKTVPAVLSRRGAF